MLNRKIFFDAIRKSVFDGSLDGDQVGGITRVLDYRDTNYSKMTNEELAYLLATATHETGHKMTPIREGGGEAYLRTKRYYPWVGEGLVQVTWEANHRKFGATAPGQLMTWPIALNAIFKGMIFGMFTGVKLSDFIRGGYTDYFNARRIVNRLDKAHLIEEYANAYLAAFKRATV